MLEFIALIIAAVFTYNFPAEGFLVNAVVLCGMFYVSRFLLSLSLLGTFFTGVLITWTFERFGGKK